MNKRLTVVFLMTSCKKSGPVKQMLNIIKNLDTKKFEPILVTIYQENPALSLEELYEPYVKHYFVPTSKMEVILGRTARLRDVLDKINPNVIHSLGVFPDFAISRMGRFNQIITLRNYVYEDYPSKFGQLLGMAMAKIHLYAIKHAKRVVACSESLSEIYASKLGLKYDFVRNGVDVDTYNKASEAEKLAIRKEIGLPTDSFVYVYTGQLIERKNMDFLLRAFTEAFKSCEVYLLVLGGGTLLAELKSCYGNIPNVDFRGNVTDINYYLKACDAYVSASKSEGLPNGVLEAMATGLPVVISDINQHMEVYEANTGVGRVFKLDDIEDCKAQMKNLTLSDYKEAGEEAYKSAHENFSAVRMSGIYQKLYSELSK